LTTNAGGWQYVNRRDQFENYNAQGRLSSMSAGGLVTALSYDGNGRLSSATNPFGRAVQFAYDGAGRVGAVTLPGGGTLGYSYDLRGNLASVRFVDNSVRQYLYENPA
jgi:YD repeat-containing protein